MSPAPHAKQRAHAHNEHGVERSDPYFWLRNKEDPEVIAHLDAENAWCDAFMAPHKELQDTLYSEMLAAVQETDSGAEIPSGAWRYYSRTEEGRPYAIHCRRPRNGGDEQILLDENALAEGHDYFSLGVFSVSPDHSRIAYATDTNGAEKYRLRVLDLSTGEHLPVELNDIMANATWAADSQTLVYTVPDDAQRPWQAWKVDALDPKPVLLLQEDDARFYMSVHRTRSDAWMVFSLGSHATSEVRVLPANDLNGEPRSLLPRRDSVEITLAHQPGRFLLRTNADAVNFKLLALAEDDLDAEPTELVAHDPEVFLADVDAFKDHLVLSFRKDGLPGLRVLPNEGEAHDVSAPEPTFDLSSARNPEFDSSVYHYAYTSPVTPSTVFAYDVNTRERSTLKVQPVPGYDASEYVADRLWATSDDGTEVPISLMHHKDVQPNGDNPMLLLGYGSYGILYEPVFRSFVLPLVKRGFVFGIAHIRGGGEMGRAWYENGKFEHKPNTFADFIASAEHLIEQGWTRADRLCIQGGSAGGLLIGNVINQHPELFGAAIARVPFVDVVTTMLDDTLPLTVIEYDEWGNPNEREVFDRMLAYSPYDNVSAQTYPPLLVTAGLNDPRVGYWEPAKWVARLRERKTGDNPLLLKTHMGAGHAGESGRYGRLRELALLYAFAISQVG